jgi:hypothetical protein
VLFKKGKMEVFDMQAHMTNLASPAIEGSPSISPPILIKNEGLPSQDEAFYILNSDERLFTAWLSVEIKDNQGQIIPMGEFKKSMPMWMARGAPITIMHSNMVVGKCLNYQFATNPATGAEGILVTGLIFKGNTLDDQAWEKVQSKQFAGVSVGGTASLKKSKDGILRGFELFEMALADKPANPAAVIETVSQVAKADTTPVKTEKINKGDFVPDDEKKPEEEKPKVETKVEPPKEEAPPVAPPKEETKTEMPPTSAPPAEAQSDTAEMKAILVKIYEMLTSAQHVKESVKTGTAPVETKSDITAVRKSEAEISTPRPDAVSDFSPKEEKKTLGDKAVEIAKGLVRFNPREDYRARSSQN